MPTKPPYPLSDSNRFANDIGKLVMFNYGRKVMFGTLMAWSQEYQRATVITEVNGSKCRLELRIGRTTGFGVLEPNTHKTKGKKPTEKVDGTQIPEH